MFSIFIRGACNIYVGLVLNQNCLGRSTPQNIETTGIEKQTIPNKARNRGNIQRYTPTTVIEEPFKCYVTQMGGGVSDFLGKSVTKV